VRAIESKYEEDREKLGRIGKGKVEIENNGLAAAAS